MDCIKGMFYTFKEISSVILVLSSFCRWGLPFSKVVPSGTDSFFKRELGVQEGKQIFRKVVCLVEKKSEDLPSVSNPLKVVIPKSYKCCSLKQRTRERTKIIVTLCMTL